MSLIKRKTLKKAISTVTAITTVVWLSGVSMLALTPTVTLAAIADGALIKSNATNPDGTPTLESLDVYIVKLVGEKKFKRLILNPEVFNSYGHLNWEDIQTVSQSVMDEYTTSSLVRVDTDPDEKVYALAPDGDTGSKSWINLTAEEFLGVAGSEDGDSIYTINSTDAGNYTAVGDITTVAELETFYSEGTLPAAEEAGTGLTVALASDTPAAASVPALASSVVYLKANFTAASDGDVTVTQIKAKRSGLGHRDDIAGVYVESDNVKLSRSKTVNSDDEVTFALNPALVVPAGETKTVEFKVNVAAAGGNVAAGNYDILSIATADDITTDGAAVNGSFPVSGNAMSIASVTVGDIAVYGTGTVDVSDTTVKVGETNQEIGKFKLTTSSAEDVTLDSIRLKNDGSSDNTDLDNIKLYRGSTLWAEDPTISGKYITFSDIGQLIQKSTDTTLTVKADIKSGATTNIKLAVDESSDIVATGASYAYPVDINNGTAGTFSTTNSTTITIDAGELTIAIDGPAASDVSDDADNVVLANLDITAGGADGKVYINKLYAEIHVTDGDNESYDPNTADTRVEYGLENIQLKQPNGTLIDASSVAYTTDKSFTDHNTSDDSMGFVTFYFANFEVEGTQTFQVIADTVKARLESGDKFAFVTVGTADGANGANDANGATAQIVGVDVENMQGKDIDTDIRPGSLVSGSTMTIATPAITMTQINLQDGNVVKKSKDVTLAKFQLKANNVEDLKLTQIKFDVESLLSGTPVASANGDLAAVNDFTNYSLYVVGESDPVQSGVSANNGSSTDDVTVEFNNLKSGSGVTIPAGESKEFLIAADAATTFSQVATANQIRIDYATNQITVEKDDGTSLLDAAITDVAYDGSRTVTVVNNGSLTVTVDGNNLSSKQVLAGTDDNEMLRLNLDATDEDVLLKKVVLTADTFVITSSNQSIVVDTDGSGTNGECNGGVDEATVTVTAGSYTGAELADEIETAIDAGLTNTWDVTYNNSTKKFTIVDSDGSATDESVCMNAAGTTLDSIINITSAVDGNENSGAGETGTVVNDGLDSIESVSLYQAIEGQESSATLVATQSSVGDDATIEFTNLENLADGKKVLVDKDQNTVLLAKVNTRAKGSGAEDTADSNDEIILTLENDSNDFECRGNDTGDDYTKAATASEGKFVIGGNADIQGNAMVVRTANISSIVAASSQASTGTLSTGIKDLMKFTITVPTNSNTDSDIVLKKLRLNISGGDENDDSNTSSDNTFSYVKVYRSDDTATKVSGVRTQFVIDSSNNILNLEDDDTNNDDCTTIDSAATATIATGTYTGTELAAAIQTALRAGFSGNAATVTYDATTRKFTVNTGDASDNVCFVTNANANSPTTLIGATVAQEVANTAVEGNAVYGNDHRTYDFDLSTIKKLSKGNTYTFIVEANVATTEANSSIQANISGFGTYATKDAVDYSGGMLIYTDDSTDTGSTAAARWTGWITDATSVAGTSFSN